MSVHQVLIRHLIMCTQVMSEIVLYSADFRDSFLKKAKGGQQTYELAVASSMPTFLKGGDVCARNAKEAETVG